VKIELSFNYTLTLPDCKLDSLVSAFKAMIPALLSAFISSVSPAVRRPLAWQHVQRRPPRGGGTAFRLPRVRGAFLHVENPQERHGVSPIGDAPRHGVRSADADSMQEMRKQAIHRQEAAGPAPRMRICPGGRNINWRFAAR
jgi:hypothetical protein